MPTISLLKNVFVGYNMPFLHDQIFLIDKFHVSSVFWPCKLGIFDKLKMAYIGLGHDFYWDFLILIN